MPYRFLRNSGFATMSRSSIFFPEQAGEVMRPFGQRPGTVPPGIASSGSQFAVIDQDTVSVLVPYGRIIQNWQQHPPSRNSKTAEGGATIFGGLKNEFNHWIADISIRDTMF